MAEDDNKTEEPTQKKLDKTREEGQFARSQDFSVALLTIGVVAVIYFYSAEIGKNIIGLLQDAFVFDEGVVRDTALIPSFLGTLFVKAMGILSPILAVTVLLAFGAAFLVGGIGFSVKGFYPKASKLNPIKGLGRMFGMKGLMELIKGVLKLALIGTTIALVVYFYATEIFSLTLMNPVTAVFEGLGILGIGLLLVSLSLLVIAAIDVPYQMISFKNQLKMSIQDIKDEYKDSEGRPEVKQRIRQKQREIAMAQTLEAVSTADVVITNPTHFAVALSYAVGTDEAPKVVAKGADFMAEKIRERARAAGVTLFEQPQLARALFFTTEPNQDIPRQLFEAVAEVIAYVFKMNSFERHGQRFKKPVVSIPPEMSFDEEGRPLN